MLGQSRFFFAAILVAGLLGYDTAIAIDGPFPEPGTPAWQSLFAVDPVEEPLGATPHAVGEGTTYRTTLKGELASFDVGRIFLTVTVADAGYMVDYKMEQNGVARWFSDGEATANASGLFGPGAEIVSSYYYNFDYDDDDDFQRTELFRETGADRLRLWSLPSYRFRQPVSVEQARGAVDPLGALVAVAFTPVPAGEDPCNRRIPVLDGRRRFDLVTKSAGGMRRVPATGKDRYEGRALRCRLIQEKVAGYKEKNRGDIEGDIWVYLVEVPDELKTETLTYVPVAIVGRVGIIGASLQAKRPTLIAADGTETKLY
ncbi:MAG: DUF3108 domain-containing protein [Pseudomonadota bacterium]